MSALSQSEFIVVYVEKHIHLLFQYFGYNVRLVMLGIMHRQSALVLMQLVLSILLLGLVGVVAHPLLGWRSRSSEHIIEAIHVGDSSLELSCLQCLHNT